MFFGEAKKSSQIYKHGGFCLSAGQECLPGVLWEELLTLLCDAEASNQHAPPPPRTTPPAAANRDIQLEAVGQQASQAAPAWRIETLSLCGG